MLKLRSISARLILAISLTVAVACGVLGTFSIIQQRSLTQLALDRELKLQYDSVIAAVDYEGRAALAVSSVIAGLPPVGDAIVKGDRQGLGTMLGGVMSALKPQGIPLITFQVQKTWSLEKVSRRMPASAHRPASTAGPIAFSRKHRSTSVSASSMRT